jgi:hypothetical protein
MAKVVNSKTNEKFGWFVVNKFTTYEELKDLLK